MQNGVIRIGIVGAGANTVSRHIPGFLSQKRVKIVGVCNRSRESSLRVANSFNIPNTYDHWTELVEDENIDAVMIGTWPYLHCPVTLAALANKKHVLCEARMAMNAEQARQMRDASLQNPSLVSQLVPSPFTLRVDKMIQRLIATGFAGDIISLEVRDYTGFPDWASPYHWRENSDLSGLNIMSLGIWYESAMRWLGVADTVFAFGSTTVKTRKDDLGAPCNLNIPDHIEVTAQMNCGAIAHYTVSRVCGFAGSSVINIYGTDGTIRFSNDTLEAGKRGESMNLVSVPSELEGKWNVEADFIDSIFNNTPVTLTSFSDGLKYMEFTQAVNESLQSGASVPVRKY